MSTETVDSGRSESGCEILDTDQGVVAVKQRLNDARKRLSGRVGRREESAAQHTIKVHASLPAISFHDCTVSKHGRCHDRLWTSVSVPTVHRSSDRTSTSELQGSW